MQQCSPDKVFWKCFIITIATTLLKCLDLQFAQLLHHLFRKFPSCQRNTKIMNFDRCLTQDDLSYIMKSTRTLKTSHICLAYKTYLKELFHTNACPKSNQKYFNWLYTYSIFKLQPCLTPGSCLLVRFLPMLEQQNTMRKFLFFFFKLGSEQCSHCVGSEKKGILVENGRFSARAWYKPSD